MDGKQVRLFLVDGTVGGLMTAEILNWTGHMIRARRKDLNRLKAREEASRTGVYVLFGTDENGEQSAYIGEADNIGYRLSQHDASKDFWDDVVLITSKDMNLTKAHARFLESKLIRTAKTLGRFSMHNGNEPSGGAALPEADTSDMEYFIRQIRILMPVLGFDIFRGRTEETIQATGAGISPTATSNGAAAAEDLVSVPQDSPLFYLSPKRSDARAQVIDGEFTLLAGSLIPGSINLDAHRAESTKKRSARIRAQYEWLKTVTEPSPVKGMVKTLKDLPLSSPSAGSALVYGTVSTQDGLVYADWENSRSGSEL